MALGEKKTDLGVLRQTVIAAGELFVFVQVSLKEQQHCQSTGEAASMMSMMTIADSTFCSQ